MWRVGILCAVAGSACGFHATAAPADALGSSADAIRDTPPDGPARVSAGLIALYTFDDNGGSTIHDTSGVSPAVDLTIGDTSKVVWSPGTLTITAATTIASPSSVQSRINLRCKETDQVTVEAWATPAVASQNGASGQFARVVTMSINSGGRNFAIGQEGSMWAAQMRTSQVGVDTQGSPILEGGAVVTTPTHLVVTADATSRILYVNGAVVASDTLGGTLDNWLPGYRLSLAGEPSLNNPWQGSLSTVAIYERALTPEEVELNFLQGPAAK